MADFDVIVIGGGPGGYVAAIRCAQLGMKTACIDSWRNARGKPALGGTCLNVGCIPSKALLDSSHHFEFLGKSASAHGIKVEGASMDIAAMHKRKDRVVQALTQGVAGLLRKHGVEWLQGHGRLLGGTRVQLTGHDGSERELEGGQLIIATGATPARIPGIELDGEYVVDSSGALSFDSVPRRLGIIGAGVIGLELGSVWRRLGAEVTLLEAMPGLLGLADRDIAREAGKVFGKQGLDIRLGARVSGCERGEDGLTLHYTQQDAAHELKVDRLVVAVGRRPNTEGLGAAEAGLSLDARGFIEVDAHCRTGVDGVWAVGDVVRGPMLAHKASEEGVAVAERIAGQKPHIDFDRVPWVIYTWPEIAWVGATEQSLEAAGRSWRSGSFPLMASGRARAMGETEGFVKILADSQSDTILGVHIMGANASELIAEAVLAMEFEASAEDIARTIHAHPTLSEAVHEAALAVDGRPIHI